MRHQHSTSFRYAGLIAAGLLSSCAMDSANSTYSTLNIGLSNRDSLTHREYGMSYFKDADGDGQANSLDRFPRNPYRY